MSAKKPTLAPHLAAHAAVKGPKEVRPPPCRRIAPHLAAHATLKKTKGKTPA